MECDIFRTKQVTSDYVHACRRCSHMRQQPPAHLLIEGTAARDGRNDDLQHAHFEDQRVP